MFSECGVSLLQTESSRDVLHNIVSILSTTGPLKGG